MLHMHGRSAGGTAADAPPPQFRLGPLSLPITEGSLSYLGVPVRTYKKGQHWAKAHDLEIPELLRLAGALTSAFRLPDMNVSCKAFLPGVHSTLLAKALYPTPVVDVDYEALDTLVYHATCRVMGLPPNAPSAAARWELRLMPSKLSAHQRALRWACRFAHYSWFYDYEVGRPPTGGRPYSCQRPRDGTTGWPSETPYGPIEGLLRVHVW
jgi:hypothetical protein